MALTEAQIKELTNHILSLKQQKQMNSEAWEKAATIHQTKHAMLTEFIERFEKLVQDWKTDK